TPRSEAYFVFPLAQGTPGKQCGLAATGVYQPSLRSPWLAVSESPPPVLPVDCPCGYDGPNQRIWFWRTTWILPLYKQKASP
ncbi:hypothetical protein, partial [Thiolapillus sp.]|uniref:hypothetical protein n=1 Tax=Thiolapillus sp. TaxID=2017437 RepID=UPI003AF9659E